MAESGTSYEGTYFEAKVNLPTLDEKRYAPLFTHYTRGGTEWENGAVRIMGEARRREFQFCLTPEEALRQVLEER